MSLLLVLLIVVAAYLLGSISFAVWVSRLWGLPDPHDYGSGNPGATNVLRTGRKSAALCTLLGDGAKGWVAVALALHWAAPDAVVAAVAVVVMLGHLWPVFHRFQGGKGVATTLGVLLALHPILGLASLCSWLIIAFFFRYSSLAALIAALNAVFFTVLLYHPAHAYVAAVAVLALLLFWRHRANIRNLIAGTESRIGGKAV